MHCDGKPDTAEAVRRLAGRDLYFASKRRHQSSASSVLISTTCRLAHLHMQEYFNVVFDNKDTLQQYHSLEGDPEASISPWSIDTRIITFSVPLSGVPEVVKKAIGESPQALL